MRNIVVKLLDNLLLDHKVLPHVLVLAVQLVNLFGQSIMLKSYWGVVGRGGDPCDYCVSPSPNNWVFGFFRLCLNLGSGFGACCDRGLGTWTWA